MPAHPPDDTGWILVKGENRLTSLPAIIRPGSGEVQLPQPLLLVHDHEMTLYQPLTFAGGHTVLGDAGNRSCICAAAAVTIAPISLASLISAHAIGRAAGSMPPRRSGC